MKIDVEELRLMIKEKYKLKELPKITKVKTRPAIGEFKCSEVGYGGTLVIYYDEV